MNAAVVPPDTLERAQDAASLVFNLSGITLAWVDATSCQARCFILRIVPVPIGEKSSDSRVLGVAPGTNENRGTDAWIFYHRIKDYSANLGLALSSMLGYVIAHELGHLLLPLNTHSLGGVMRPEWMGCK